MAREETVVVSGWFNLIEFEHYTHLLRFHESFFRALNSCSEEAFMSMIKEMDKELRKCRERCGQLEHVVHVQQVCSNHPALASLESLVTHTVLLLHLFSKTLKVFGSK